MVLVINCIVDAEERRRFDQVVLPRLRPLSPEPFAVRHLVSAAEPLDDGGDHGFLLISGSELSAARDHERDGELCDLVRSFASAGKPILGICYGHQMVVRALGGACRRAAVPEFGWKRVETRPNPLFTGLDDWVPMHSHYDEVVDLPATLECIAWTEDCAVQAIQVRDRPIWGVQCHPELSFEDGQRMMRSNLKTEPEARRRMSDELTSPAQVDDQLRIFANFFAAERGAEHSEPVRTVAVG